MVPARQAGELVVGQGISALVGGRRLGQPEGRNFSQAQMLGGRNAAMAGDDVVAIADQDRIGESKPRDAVGDLPDLPF